MQTIMMYEIFPAEYIALNVELLTGCHPTLERILQQHGPNDIDMKLAQIAAYCSVELDGVYSLEERIKLCDLLLKRLIPMREEPEVLKNAQVIYSLSKEAEVITREIAKVESVHLKIGGKSSKESCIK